MDIDHIGFVVEDIHSGIDYYTVVYGYLLEEGPIYDSVQHVNLAMLSSSNGYRIELIQPVDAKSPSYDFLKKGGGLHHFCYYVPDIEDTIRRMKQCGHLLFKRPIEAVLFGGRKVAFLFSKRDKQIIELVESEAK
jgi:methylmalonyl-CoA/ethylmalonyl-CoA epimerase